MSNGCLAAKVKFNSTEIVGFLPGSKDNDCFLITLMRIGAQRIIWYLTDKKLEEQVQWI